MRNLVVLCSSFLYVAASGFAQPPDPVMNGRTTAGSYVVHPDSAISGVYGTWAVVYTVGAKGIAQGGGIRVQLPDEMHAGPRNSAIRLQATNPADDHYVTATCSRDEVEVRAWVEHEVENELVKHAKPSLDGRFERYVFVVRVQVVQGALQEGDTITVVYGDTSGGSRGMRPGEVTGADLPVLLALDATGSSTFGLHTQPASISIEPGPAAYMLLHAPSQAVVDKPIRVLVSLLDAENNPVHVPASVRISIESGEAAHPSAVDIPAGQGYVEFEAMPQATGTLRFHTWADDKNVSAVSNPCVVSASEPESQVLWGELHSHTHYSWDGVGYDNFNYARYAMGLDFYAMTDHSNEPAPEGTKGLHSGLWDEYTAKTEKYNAPPEFVTIHAYECSFGTPYGHHNVFFRSEPGPLLNPQTVTLPELWKALDAGNALTIPHHTGKFPKDVDYSYHDPEMRRNFEIYSGHGLSEVHDPSHPLAFENSQFTSDSSSLDWPSHAQDVWARGLQLSTVAASDDHRAQPGKPFYGLTAVRTTENSRDAVFQALYDRRTYGTTGAKIILDFTLNGEPMGSILDAADTAELKLEAVGTDIIAVVELLRHQPGEDGFIVIQAWTPNAPEFSESFTDEACTAGSVYYMRLRQANDIGGRIVMAWSSPIWIRNDG
jgi:hypothetical protein